MVDKQQSESESQLPDELSLLPGLNDEDRIKRWVKMREAMYTIAFAIEDKTILSSSDGKRLVAFDRSDINELSEALDGFEWYG